MDATINIAELASELADRELRCFFNGKIDIKTEDGVRYTEEAQDVFNELYEEFYTLIENCKL